MKLQYFVWIISIILIGTICRLVFNRLYNTKSPKTIKYNNANIIKPNKTFFYVGVFVAVAMIILLFVCSFLPQSTNFIETCIAYVCLALLFASLCGYLIIFSINYRIIVFDDYFIYQNFWRIKKIIYYKDVVINRDKLYPQIRIKKNNDKTKLVFKLAGILENEDAFMSAYKKWKNKPKSKQSDQLI